MADLAASDDFDADLNENDGIDLDSTDLDNVVSDEDTDEEDADVDLDADDKSEGDTDDETPDPDLDEEDEEEGEESLEVVLLGQDEKATRTKAPRTVPSAVTATVGEGEFTCRSCFLVKRRAQLADEEQMICFDCA